MKPDVFTLPETLRNALDARLTEATPTEAIAAVQDVLFSSDTAAPDRDFLDRFQQYLLHFQIGATPPAMMLCNPPERGDLFTQALFTLLHHDTTELRALYPNSTVDVLDFHQDQAYHPGIHTKNLRGIYCREPGTTPQPTVFLTADEIIQAMACTRLGLSPASSLELVEKAALMARYQQEREAIIAGLSQVIVDTFALDGGDDTPHELHKFLTRNEHFTPANGAPEFLICSSHYHREDAIWGGAIYAEFRAATEALRTRAAQESYASTVPNSVLLWLDPGVYHDRAGERDIQSDLTTISAQPHIASEKNPFARVTDYPLCLIQAHTAERASSRTTAEPAR